MFIIYLLFMFFVFVLLLILVGGIALRNMVRRFFGSGSPWGGGQRPNSGQQQSHTAYQAPPSKPKLFDKDEGEYVDYEELQ